MESKKATKSFDVMQASASSQTLIPGFKLFYLPYAYIIDNFILWLKLVVLFALTIGAVSLISGFAYVCGLPQLVNFHCSNSLPLFAIDILFKYFLLFFFACKWYALIKTPTIFSWKFLFSFDRKILKAFAALSIILVLNIIPFVSFSLLAMREPNPDVVVEITYFGVVSIGFLVPFVVLRFYSVLGLILEGVDLPSLKSIWVKTQGNSLRIILSLFSIFILTLFLFLNFYLNIRTYDFSNPLWVGISSEFVYEVLLLLIWSLFVGHCYTQKYFLYGDEDEGNN